MDLSTIFSFEIGISYSLSISAVFSPPKSLPTRQPRIFSGSRNSLCWRSLKFIFNFKLLQHKLFLEPEKMRGCLVGRDLGGEKTAEILKEYEMPISKEKIVERSISLGPLVYFDAKNVRNVFGLAFNPSIAVTKQLHSWRLDFECFLASQLAQELHILP